LLIAGAKDGDQSRHIPASCQPTEPFHGFEDTGRDPAQHHLPAAPPLHIPLHVTRATEQALGGIRRGQGSLEP
jgi:hypothetical protein